MPLPILRENPSLHITYRLDFNCTKTRTKASGSEDNSKRRGTREAVERRELMVKP
jgi:hypothetical protein